jgi:hypothetical protein
MWLEHPGSDPSQHLMPAISQGWNAWSAANNKANKQQQQQRQQPN